MSHRDNILYILAEARNYLYRNDDLVHIENLRLKVLAGELTLEELKEIGQLRVGIG